MCAVDHALQAGKSDLADLLQNWHLWQEYRLQYCLGILPFSGQINRSIYDFLLPKGRAELCGCNLPIIARCL
jgi:hypothetical protein